MRLAAELSGSKVDVKVDGAALSPGDLRAFVAEDVPRLDDRLPRENGPPPPAKPGASFRFHRPRRREREAGRVGALGLDGRLVARLGHVCHGNQYR